MSSSGTPEGTGEADETAPELTDEERAQLNQAAEQVAAIRAQLAAAPPELVVTNHVMGLYELAAVHLDHAVPDLAAARLAIDALGGVLDACQGRLGDTEATLVGARSQIQLAFVAVSERSGRTSAAGGEAPPRAQVDGGEGDGGEGGGGDDGGEDVGGEGVRDGS